MAMAADPELSDLELINSDSRYTDADAMDPVLVEDGSIAEEDEEEIEELEIFDEYEYSVIEMSPEEHAKLMSKAMDGLMTVLQGKLRAHAERFERRTHFAKKNLDFAGLDDTYLSSDQEAGSGSDRRRANRRKAPLKVFSEAIRGKKAVKREATPQPEPAPVEDDAPKPVDPTHRQYFAMMSALEGEVKTLDEELQLLHRDACLAGVSKEKLIELFGSERSALLPDDPKDALPTQKFLKKDPTKTATGARARRTSVTASSSPRGPRGRKLSQYHGGTGSARSYSPSDAMQTPISDGLIIPASKKVDRTWKTAPPEQVKVGVDTRQRDLYIMDEIIVESEDQVHRIEDAVLEAALHHKSVDENMLRARDALSNAAITRRKMADELVEYEISIGNLDAAVNREIRDLQATLARTTTRAQETQEQLKRLLGDYLKWKNTHEEGERHRLSLNIVNEVEQSVAGPSSRSLGIQNHLEVEMLSQTTNYLQHISEQEEVCGQHIQEIARLGEQIGSFNRHVEAELVCPSCNKLSAEMKVLWPCGHSFCEQCVEDRFISNQYRCDTCGMSTQERPVTNIQVNGICGKLFFKHSGFHNLKDALKKFCEIIETIDDERMTIVSSIKLTDTVRHDDIEITREMTKKWSKIKRRATVLR